MRLKYLFTVLSGILKNLYFLTFVNGFLLSSLIYFRMEASYEYQVFSSIKKNIDRKIDADDTQDSVVVKVMQTCNTLLSSRSKIFKDDDLEGIKVDYMHPATIDLMTAHGACGSYSMVLARLFQTYNLPVRIGQMKAHGIFASHNITEVKIHQTWVVLDPTFNIYFTTPENRLAAFSDLHNSWSYYRKQLPATYDLSYKYDDVRYTNWTKIPIILPALKKTLDVLLGKEKADGICLRVLFLRVYDLYFYCALLLLIPIFLYTILKIIKAKLFAGGNTPVTFSNFAKRIKERMENGTHSKRLNT